eukprot:m.214 g.214  ORF g.214 m.214 type:complete len:415 (-) comp71_c0_seq1:40-1284(-)
MTLQQQMNQLGLALAVVGLAMCIIILLALLNARQQHNQAGRFLIATVSANVIYCIGVIAGYKNDLAANDPLRALEDGFCTIALTTALGFFGMLAAESALLGLTLFLLYMPEWRMTLRHELYVSAAVVCAPVIASVSLFGRCMACPTNASVGTFVECYEDLDNDTNIVWLSFAAAACVAWVWVLVVERGTNNSLVIRFDPAIDPRPALARRQQLSLAKKELLDTVWSPVRLLPLQFAVFGGLIATEYALQRTHNASRAFVVVSGLVPIKGVLFSLLYLLNGRECRQHVADLFCRPRAPRPVRRSLRQRGLGQPKSSSSSLNHVRFANVDTVVEQAWFDKHTLLKDGGGGARSGGSVQRSSSSNGSNGVAGLPVVEPQQAPDTSGRSVVDGEDDAKARREGVNAPQAFATPYQPME